MFRWARSCEERHDVTERLTLPPFLVDDYDNSDKWLLQSWNKYHLPLLKNKRMVSVDVKHHVYLLTYLKNKP